MTRSKIKYQWRPVDIDTMPLSTSVLLWWVSINPENVYAHVCVIGQVSEHEPDKWWNGQTGKYQDLSLITHWMPLPAGPRQDEI